jgi:DNA-binding XRE family transcriptional regulator
MRPIEELPRSHWRNQSVPEFGSLGSIEKFMYKGFRDTLLGFVEDKGMSDVDCYKRANVSRQTWHKIITDRNYTPKKNTAIALAISLQLNIDETQALLASAGFILSKSSLFDVIIMFCIVKGIYDVFEIDSILFQYDQENLFSRE